MEDGFGWIYLIIFMAIPLARILPRLLKKIRKADNSPFQTIQEGQFQPRYEEVPNEPEPQREIPRPKTNKMLVLGEINRRTMTFENIQRNTGIDNKELDSILDDLEKNEMVQVVKKQGLTGPKIELHPTDKGVKEYYS